MKILHLANWNSTNIGNGALIFGTERILAEDAPMPVEFVPEAWDDYTFKRKKFNETFVKHVNTYDALMVNGAVTFNAFRHTMYNTGMRFNLPLALWDDIQVPIILYGLSYRCWPFQEYPNADALKKTIEYCLARKDVFFGVRNDGTKEWIKNRLGIDSPNIYEVPDPGIFVPYEERDYPELAGGKLNIMLAFNGEDALYRYATPIQKMVWKLLAPYVAERHLKRLFSMTRGYEGVRRALVKKIARAVEAISREVDAARFILVPHYLDDYEMIGEFINEVQERIAHQCVVSTGLLTVPQTPYFYGRYRKADLALSMRVHSMSPSIGLGVPVIPITSQGRMRLFLEKMQLADIAVDVSKDDFVERVTERAVKLLADPEPFREQTKQAVKRMRDEAKRINEIVFSVLAARS